MQRELRVRGVFAAILTEDDVEEKRMDGVGKAVWKESQHGVFMPIKRESQGSETH